MSRRALKRRLAGEGITESKEGGGGGALVSSPPDLSDSFHLKSFSTYMCVCVYVCMCVCVYVRVRGRG
jgi:hypothetical protein